MESRINNDTMTYFLNLFPLAPDYVTEKTEMSEIYSTESYSVGYLQHALADIIDQCFLSTASWSLKRWENIFAVETNRALTHSQRRELLLTKIRGQATSTIELLKKTAEVFSGGEVNIIEDTANNKFTIRFVGVKGIPQNMQGFVSLTDEIKPAHLVCVFEYRYTVWSELADNTWDSINTTWDAIKTLKEA